MLKRILSTIFVLVVVFGLFLITPTSNLSAFAEDLTEGDYTYKVTDGEATIWGCNDPSGDIVLPSTLGGYPVTGIADLAFEYCTALTSVTIPDSVTTIGEYAFVCCASLTEIVLPDSITVIPEGAFDCCSSLTNITIPDSVTTIGNNAFQSCASLTNITIPNSVTTIGDSAFNSCDSLTEIVFPASVTSIGDHAFHYCGSLTDVNIPAGVTSIGGSAFGGNESLKNINVDQGNTNYSDKDGILFDKAQTELVCYPAGRSANYTIPKSVTSIGDYAFSVCTNLSNVVIPDSVTKIGDNAFCGCASLTAISIPDSVTSIGDSAFEYCESLVSITIPDNVTSIGDSAFEYCESLVSITIPDSVTSIGDSAFAYCESLVSITIPDSVTSIGDSAFAYCESLVSITIPDSVTSIGDSAFEYCESLVSITIPDSVTSIGDSAFAYCESLVSITISDSVTKIGDNAFCGCASLTAITLPDSVTSIGDSAFAYCESLVSITVPDSVTTIGDSTFAYCDSLTGIIISGSVAAIEYEAFAYCSSLKDVYFVGTKEDWNKIQIDEHNEGNFELTSAAIHFANTAVSASTDGVIRLAGNNRCETAAEISKACYDHASYVIIASGDTYADSLVGVPLAHALDAPILLVRNHTLDLATVFEIKCLEPNKVIILGGELAVNGDVAAAIEQMDIDVERIAGDDRFGTSLEIAKKLQSVSGNPSEIFFVYSHNYPDALAVSGIAAAKNCPVIYIADTGKLTEGIASFVKSSGANKATIISGPAIVNKAAEGNIKNAGVSTVNRIYGADRYETCIKINEAYANVFTGNAVCVATGTNYPDALAGGVFAAKNTAPLVLVPAKPTNVQTDYIRAEKPANIYIFGGTGAVSSDIENQLTSYIKK